MPPDQDVPRQHAYTTYGFIALALIGAAALIFGPLQNYVKATLDIGVLPAFTCGTSQVEDADGNLYDTVQIGTQCWMAQNLRVGTTVNVSTTHTDNDIIERWCWNNDDANCDTADNPNHPDGGIYQWNEAMQYSTTPGAQGICPDGWHIPTHDEFTTLERAVCTSGTCTTDFPYDITTTGWRGTDEGTKLKANGSSGFEGNLSGFVDTGFVNRTLYGYFWTSTESGSNAWSHFLGTSFATVHRYTIGKPYGFSIRCVRDDSVNTDPVVTIATTPSIPALDEGLVGHWTFDGPQYEAVVDRTDNNLHGYFPDGATTSSLTAGILGQALGPVEVIVDDDPLLSFGTGSCPGDPFSVSIWVDKITWDYSAIIKKYDSPPSSVEWEFYAFFGELRFVVWDTDGDDNRKIVTGLSGSESGWTHLTITYDGSTNTSGMSIYINGQKSDNDQSADVGYGCIQDTSTRLTIGGSHPMDDVRIYDRALSADEVQRLYKLGEGTKIATTIKTPGSPLEQGLVGHWTFDGPDVRWQDTTSEIKDVSGNNNHGDAQGGMGVRSPVMGVLGQGMGFDGSNDYINIPDDDLFSFTDGSGNDRPFTVAAYVKPSSGSGMLLCKFGLSAEWGIFANPLGVELWESDYSAKLRKQYLAGLPLHEWSLVVVTYDGSETSAGIKIYLDGSEIPATDNSSGTYDGMSNTNVTLHLSEYAESYADGSLDDVRIYNRALSAEEVQMLYQLGR